MGTLFSVESKQKEQKIYRLGLDCQKFSKSNFVIQSLIDKGNYGNIFKVQLLNTDINYTMKTMNKSSLFDNFDVNLIHNEKNLLQKFNHPYSISINSIYISFYSFILVSLSKFIMLSKTINFAEKGNLYDYMNQAQRFNEEQTRFMTANIILGLKYLYDNQIIHTRITPQHLLVDSKGYLTITGFKQAIMNTEQEVQNYMCQDITQYTGININQSYLYVFICCIQYMIAPEFILREKPSYSSDYYSLGLILYEMITGKNLKYIFQDDQQQNRKQDFKKELLIKAILQNQTFVMKTDLPEGWSLDSADFINKLMQKNPLNRLGYFGIEELLEHPWIKDLLWDKILNKNILSPLNLSGIKESSSTERYQTPVLRKFDQEIDYLRFQILFEEYYYFKGHSEHNTQYNDSNMD